MQKQRGVQDKPEKLFFPLIAIFSLITVSAFFIFTDEVAKLSSANNDRGFCRQHVYENWGSCQTDRTRSRKVEFTCDEKKYIHVQLESCSHDHPSCAFGYSDWSACQADGTRTREISASCGEKKYIHVQTESCDYAQPPCTFDYSDWSACQADGTRTRKISASCDGKKSIDAQTESCDYAQPPCAFDYSDWGACQASWNQNRIITGKSPANCQGGVSEPLVRNCIYSPPPFPCADYNYSDWNSCQNNFQARTVISGKDPSGCSITDSRSTSPLIKQSCAIQNPSDDQASNNSQDIRPEFIFLELSGGTTLKGNFTIKGKVNLAKTVEFYSIISGSNTPVLIGSAKNVSNNYWELTFDTTKKPNGSFYLVAKIKNDYGSEYYESSRIQVYINNLTNPTSDQSDNTSSQSPDAATSQKYSQSEQDSSALPENFNGRTSSEWQKKYFNSKDCFNNNHCAGEADPDKDGLINNDEFRYKTDPLNPDSDEDSFLDGDEIKNGFDPLWFSPGDKSDRMIFESPKENGEIKKEIYQISTVALVFSDDEAERNIFLSGKGLSDSFINIYIYSDLPMILSTVTDSDGNWSYVLDKQLADGQHEAYVVVTDNTGKITAKSDPLFFVKTAEAVTVIPPAEASALNSAASPVKKRRSQDLIFIFALIVLGFIASMTVIGFYLIRLRKKNGDLS